ncbi:MAG: hypothetical protein MK089_07915, partial [Phycisphaerales bacterium]|nr:hypothetical protein [Phycisphaerales bacterium]
GWRWITGETWDWQDWGGCGPDNYGDDQDNLQFGTCSPGSAIVFNDIQGDVTSNNIPSYLIEWSADCNGDGIVDYGQILDGTLEDLNGNGVPDCCDNDMPCAIQWKVEDGGNGHWYGVEIVGPVTWSTARTNALAVGGDLTSLETHEEMVWVYDTMASNPQAWLISEDFDGPLVGGYQDVDAPDFDEPDGGWYWLTGIPFDPIYWATGGPNNNGGGQGHLRFLGGNGYIEMTFDDVNFTDASESISYVVEWSADCNGDGLVDYGQILDGSLSDDDGNGVPDCCDDTSCLPAVQWKVEDGGNGHWYQLMTQSGGMTWSDADTLADTSGGHLATLTSEEENTFVTDAIDNSGSVQPWIGLYQDTDADDYSEPFGGWRWVNGETYDWTNWDVSEPSDGGGIGEDETNIWLSGSGRTRGTWNDYRLNYGDGYVIEWSADCNGDGLVDYGQILDGSLSDDDGNGVPDCCDDTSCLAPVQWKVEDGGNGHWYQAIVHDEITYQEAQDQAVAVGGQLTSLTSQEESDYVTNFIADKPNLWVYDVNGCLCGGPWIGGYREAFGDWFWLDGEAWSYTNWHGGNPDGNAASAQALRLWDYCCKRWVDHSMDGEAGSIVISSIIEWSADCNDDGIVDYGQILDGSLLDEDGNGIPDDCDDLGSDISLVSIARGSNNVDDPEFNWTTDIYVTVPAGGRLDAVAGNQDTQKMVTSSGLFYQNGFGGPLSTDVNPIFYEFDQELEWDSRFTIGALDSSGDPFGSNDLNDIGIDWTDFELGYGLDTNNGTWFVVPTAAQGESVTFYDTDCQPQSGVLVARLTTFGEESVIQFNALLQGKDETGDTWQESVEMTSGYEAIEDCNSNGINDQCDIANGDSADADANGIPDECECPSDITGDDVVDITDLLIVIGAWGSDYPPADVTGDGEIGIEDLLEVINAWGSCDP